MRRIIGQFHQADLSDIEHLASVVDRPDILDTSTLSKKQQLAFRFLRETFKRGVPWKLVRSVVKEVLFWGETDKVVQIEVRFFPKPDQVSKFKSIWK